MKIYLIAIATILFASCSNTTTRGNLVGNWIEVMPMSLDVVEGMTLSKNGVASSIGMETLKYESWSENGEELILCGKSIGNGVTSEFCDTLTICSITADSLVLEKFGRYKINYHRVASLNELKPFDIKDSLSPVAHTTEIETRVFKGVLPNQSCIELKHTLTLYNYKNCGDGVYKLTTTFLSSNQESDSSNSYGRLYTLKGDKKDPNAILYQLISFESKEVLNFSYKKDSLILLNSDFAYPAHPTVLKIEK
ncbi:MAG: lipocalin family protein [Phocaeicola sp.]